MAKQHVSVCKVVSRMLSIDPYTRYLVLCSDKRTARRYVELGGEMHIVWCCYREGEREWVGN